MPLSFENPPINEVSLGFWFDQPLATLRSEHLGLFWAQVRKNYPIVQQAAPLFAHNPPEGLLNPLQGNEIFPMPRYWLMQAPVGGYLIQIQRNAFFVNWRRGGAEYQRFDGIKQEFDRRFAEFQAFVLGELDAPAPAPRVCDLNYINLIEKDDFWSGWRDTAKVIKNFAVANAPDAECSFNQVALYPVGNGITMTVTTKNGSRAETGNEVLVLDLKAQGALEHGTTTTEWFTHAHDEVHSALLSVTTEEVRKRCWRQL